MKDCCVSQEADDRLEQITGDDSDVEAHRTVRETTERTWGQDVKVM